MSLGGAYLWLKALHIAFMVTWFAGLFYLPRLFIYHSQAEDEVSLERFNVMERRLFGIMTIGAVLTAILGVLLLIANSGLLALLWFQLKLVLLVGMVVYHWRCRRWIVALRENPRSGKYPLAEVVQRDSGDLSAGNYPARSPETRLSG